MTELALFPTKDSADPIAPTQGPVHGFQGQRLLSHGTTSQGAPSDGQGLGRRGGRAPRRWGTPRLPRVKTQPGWDMLLLPQEPGPAHDSAGSITQPLPGPRAVCSVSAAPEEPVTVSLFHSPLPNRSSPVSSCLAAAPQGACLLRSSSGLWLWRLRRPRIQEEPAKHKAWLFCLIQPCWQRGRCTSHQGAGGLRQARPGGASPALSAHPEVPCGWLTAR